MQPTDTDIFGRVFLCIPRWNRPIIRRIVLADGIAILDGESSVASIFDNVEFFPEALDWKTFRKTLLSFNIPFSGLCFGLRF